MNTKTMLKSILLNAMTNLRRAKYAPRVVYYHSIHPSLPRSLPPDVFRQQIEWLQANGYRFLTFAELVEQALAGTAPNRCISITFDDGYIDNYEYALPVLLEARVPATFFVVSGMIAEIPVNTNGHRRLHAGKKMMTCKQLRELVSLGMEVGSHTRSHVHVKNVLCRSSAQAWDETAGSKRELEQIIGAQVSSFAYPNGQRGVFNASTRALLKRAGYKYAATTIWGSLDRRCDPLEVPRTLVRYDDGLEVFISKMRGWYDFIRWIHLVRDGSRKWEYGDNTQESVP